MTELADLDRGDVIWASDPLSEKVTLDGGESVSLHLTEDRTDDVAAQTVGYISG